MKVIVDILNNHIIKVGAISWLMAQILKFILYYVVHREFDFERIVGAGGMPSSHSALVCSACIAIYKQCGSESAIFALSLILAVIVMYDSMGVRRAAGEQAKVINKVIIYPMNNKEREVRKEINGDSFEAIAMKRLKELLGHTPLEVLGGAVVGIIVSLVLC